MLLLALALGYLSQHPTTFFLLCGLPAWVFFATSLQAASRSLLENANLIRKVRFPRQLVPLANVAIDRYVTLTEQGGR